MEIKASEEWSDIAGFEDCYQISDNGNMRSKDRTVTDANGVNRNFKSKPVRIWVKDGHYCKVSLSKGNIKKSFTVHRLVAIAFIPNPLNKITVNHIDGNRHNNHVSNLEWATYNENMQHAYDTGLLENCTYLKGNKGEKHPYSKLTPMDIEMIKCLHNGGFNYPQIAPKFNVHSTHIGLIVKNKSWSHLNQQDEIIS